jgi:isoquinoline 1-oxidoreductase subunit beta
MHVEYVRVEPPGIPTAFWRSVGPSHNVFVTESFIDELAAAAKQDPFAYRRPLLDKAPRAKAVLELVAEKAGWGGPLPKGVGRGVSVQFVFATFMAQVAEVVVARDGAVRVRRVVSAVDCATSSTPIPSGRRSRARSSSASRRRFMARSPSETGASSKRISIRTKCCA